MIEKARLVRILSLAGPIIAGMASQNILNLVDTYFVGHLGDAALSAVGLGGFACFLFQALLIGISVGVQATASRRIGEGDISKAAAVLNSGLFCVVIGGILLTLILLPQVTWIFPLLNQDPLVVKEGVPYLQIRILGIMFVGINFAFRGFWNAINRPTLYLRTIVCMHVANIFLSYILIFGHLGMPAMGVEGAGIGSLISIILGSAIYFCLGLKEVGQHGFLKSFPKMADLRSLVRLSLPNSIQQVFFSGGFVALYWIIGLVGTRELAAANVLINILLVCILPGIGLGLASSSLVGQAIGRGDPADAKNWGWDVAKIGFIAIGLLGLPMCFVPDLLLRGFLQDPETLAVARAPIILTGMTIWMDVLGLIFMNSLLGAGATRSVMKVSISLQWLFFLPMAFLVGPHWGGGLIGIWALQQAYRGGQAVIFALMWRRGAWAKIAV